MCGDLTAAVRAALSDHVEPRALSVDGAAAALSVEHKTVRALIADGRLGHVRIGRRVLVPVAAIDTYLERETRCAAS